MKLSLLTPKKSFNKTYRKEKVIRSDIELLKQNLTTLFNNIGHLGDEAYLSFCPTYSLCDDLVNLIEGKY